MSRRFIGAALALAFVLAAGEARAFTYSGTVESALADTGPSEQKTIPIAGDPFTLDYNGYFRVPAFDVHSDTFDSDFHSNGVFNLGAYAPLTKQIIIHDDEIDISFLLFGVFHADFSGQAEFKLLVTPVPLPSSLPMSGGALLALISLAYGKRLRGTP